MASPPTPHPCVRSRRAPQPGPLSPGAAHLPASPSACPEPGSLGQHGGVATARRAAGRGRRPSGPAAAGPASAARRSLRTARKGAIPVGQWGWGGCYPSLAGPGSPDGRRHLLGWPGVSGRWVSGDSGGSIWGSAPSRALPIPPRARGAVQGTSTSYAKGCAHPCVRAWDVMTGGEVWCPCACPLM